MHGRFAGVRTGRTGAGDPLRRERRGVECGLWGGGESARARRGAGGYARADSRGNPRAGRRPAAAGRTDQRLRPDRAGALRRGRMVGSLHPQGALPGRGQEDDGLRTLRAAGGAPARRDRLPDGRRHRPDRDVEGVRRDGGAGVDRFRAAEDVLRAVHRLRADGEGVGGRARGRWHVGRRGHLRRRTARSGGGGRLPHSARDTRIGGWGGGGSRHRDAGMGGPDGGRNGDLCRARGGRDGRSRAEAHGDGADWRR